MKFLKYLFVNYSLMSYSLFMAVTIAIFSPISLFGMDGQHLSPEDLFGKSDDYKEKDVVFAHGHGSDFSHSESFDSIFSRTRTVGFNFPDVVVKNGVVEKQEGRDRPVIDLAKASFGQEGELEVMEKKFGEVIAQNKDGELGKKKVLVAGVSRGAMCVLTGKFDGAVGRFAESPGASLKDIIDHKCKQFGLGWIPCLGRFIHRWLIRPIGFKGYNPKGIKPIDKVKDIPKDTPVFISCTKKDGLIPASSSARLAEELVRTGHKEVYFYVSDIGKHGNMIIGKDYYNIEYVNASEAFLKKIGMHLGYVGINNRELLEKCKIKDLAQIRKIRRQLEWANWKKCWIQNAVVLGAVVTSAFLLKSKVANLVSPFLKSNFTKGLFSKTLRA